MKICETYTPAGVAIIVNNKLTKLIDDIQPINDRLISITFGSQTKLSIINNYAHTAAACTEDKNKHYNALLKIQKKWGKAVSRVGKTRTSSLKLLSLCAIQC